MDGEIEITFDDCKNAFYKTEQLSINVGFLADITFATFGAKYRHNFLICRRKAKDDSIGMDGVYYTAHPIGNSELLEAGIDLQINITMETGRSCFFSYEDKALYQETEDGGLVLI